VRVWQLGTTAPAEPDVFLDPRLEEVRALVFTPNNDLLVSASGLGGRIWRWSWHDRTNDDFVAVDDSTCADKIAVAADGRCFAAIDNKRVCFWEKSRSSWLPRTPATGRGANLTALAFTPSGQSLFTGDAAGAVQIWAIEGRRLRPRDAFMAHRGAVHCLATS